MTSSYPIVIYGCAALLLLAVHSVTTGFSGTLQEPRLSSVGITPATTLTHWWRHLWAGLVHTNVAHIAFNLALFTIAFPFAMRGHDPLRTLLGAYWIGPVTVFVLHVLVVLPLAQGGFAYALSALHRPLVGFSVIAYALAGMAVVQAPRPIALGITATVVAFELTVGAVLRFTGPFIFAYHLAGFGVGALMRGVFRQPA